MAFLTGRSDPARCALSTAQQSFLERLRLPEGAGCPFNFPYRPGPPYRRTPLLRASLNNARIYLQARRPTFARRYGKEVRTLLDGARHTVFLAGSCGLELLAGLDLEPERLERISVFAYGPVARSVPRCRTLLIQGRGDWISRWFFRRVDHLIPGGHLDYLSHPEVLRLCREFIHGPL